MIENEKISIISNGVRLGGTLFYPDTPKPVPGVCICHGIPRENKPVEEKGYPFLAKKFCEKNCAALIFNFQGTSGSEGEFSFSNWSRNVLDAISHLASNPRVNPERLGLVSFSAGAFVSWAVVANDQRIKAFASCSSPSDLAKIPFIGEGIKYAEKYEILKITDIKKALKELKNDLRELNPLKWAEKISPRPVLIVHGDQDEVVPVQSAHDLYQKAKEPKKILIFKNVNHQIRKNQEAMDTVVDWTVKNI
ncbi:MAG: alpha/beta hydrolase family protein [Candidatus Jordarchaeum sp.]|uniref:alpha/beta hydrolase family protein n=1 Tax=Candidatus Jordarchaeum sp. TaxID=2823881 RepID=UPI00404950AB